MNKRICFIGAVLWGILVISVSTGTVRAGSQALRCEGNNACLNNTGTVAFGSCNGPQACARNSASIAPNSCDEN
jgi:hypothetical protein